MSMEVRQEVTVNKHQDLACAVRKKADYVGRFNCKKAMYVYKANMTIVGRFPKTCATGDSLRDHRCHPSLPGYGHPHVIMMDDYFYTLYAELP